MRQEIRYGKKIVELRRARGWTQEHLAEATLLEARTIQRAEKDETKGPETLQAIAGAFDVALADMQTVRLIPELTESTLFPFRAEPTQAEARNTFFAIARMCFGRSSMRLARLRSTD